MDSSIKGRFSIFIYLILGLCLVSNFVICFSAVSRVRSSKREYEITEQRFLYAVNQSVTNFLYGLVQSTTTNALPTNSYKQESLEDLLIYYRYSKKQWVARYAGSDFYTGDYFGSGLILMISEGRLYVKDGNNYIVFRPRVPATDARFPRAVTDTRAESDL